MCMHVLSALVNWVWWYVKSRCGAKPPLAFGVCMYAFGVAQIDALLLFFFSISALWCFGCTGANFVDLCVIFSAPLLYIYKKTAPAVLGNALFVSAAPQCKELSVESAMTMRALLGHWAGQ